MQAEDEEAEEANEESSKGQEATASPQISLTLPPGQTFKQYHVVGFAT